MAHEWTTVRQWPVLILERLADAGVARITLNRPEKRNALSHELFAAFIEALQEIRRDPTLLVVITRGNGPVFCAGLDLHDLNRFEQQAPEEWDTTTPSTRLYEAVRRFPRVMIAQIHGYCLGGAVALLNSHDLAIAATNAQIGMPEILRGSFGQNVTATLWHSNIPIKKAAFIQLTGRNLTGAEADRLGIVSMAVEESELEETTTSLAHEIASRHPAALQHAKIAVHLGRDLPLEHAMQVDRLVGARMKLAVDPLSHVSDYLSSQRGGTNTEYTRPDAVTG